MAKILCLHGFQQNAFIFQRRCGALRRHLKKKNHELIFMNAPIVLLMNEVNGLFTDHERQNNDLPRAWFSKASASERQKDIEKSLLDVLEFMTLNGPFDGIMGFSQGGFMASLVAMALENRNSVGYDLDLNPPLKFAVFMSPNEWMKGIGSSVISPVRNDFSTPVQVFIGLYDAIVPGEASRALASYYKNPQIIEHPYGHAVLYRKDHLIQMSNFIDECMSIDMQDSENNVEEGTRISKNLDSLAIDSSASSESDN